MRKGELVPLILTVCPDIKEQPGKVTLISRFGADNVEAMLPAFIKEVQAAGLKDVVIWCCDPMHVGAPRGPLHGGSSTRAAPRGSLHGVRSTREGRRSFYTDVRSILMVL